MKLTRKQLEEVLDHTQHYTLAPDWDGNMDKILLFYPNPYNPWTSARAETNEKLILEYYNKHFNSIVHPCS